MHHAILPSEGKAPGVRAADSHVSGAKGEGLEHVGAGADARIEQHRRVTGGLDDVGKAVEGGQAAVRVAGQLQATLNDAVGHASRIRERLDEVQRDR